MDANKGFCFRFWERRGADIYLASNGRCAAEIYGQSFDESGPITRTGNWTRLSDSVLSEWAVYAAADSGALVDTYFDAFNVLYNERMLEALEAKYPGLEIGDTIYEDRVYHATINGKRVVVKLLATNMVDVDEYLTKIRDLLEVEAPIVHYGLLDFTVNGIPEQAVYNISEYLPIEYASLPQGKKIELFTQLDEIIEEIHHTGYSRFDLHGGNFLYSPERDLLYAIDVDELQPNLDNAEKDNSNLMEFKQLVLAGKDIAED